jgi:hypothetical protein
MDIDRLRESVASYLHDQDSSTPLVSPLGGRTHYAA